MAAPAPFQFLPLGAIIQTFLVGEKNIVQNFPTQELYTTHNSPFFGETIGRVANRIAKGKFSLNGKTYSLARNNSPNHLHGGNVGWGKHIWKGPTSVDVKSIPGIEGLKGGESVKFERTSEDGEESYPGTVVVSVIYTTGTVSEGGKEANVLGIEYEAKLVGDVDVETVINITNHSYFNLTGNPTIEGTEVSLCTTDYLPLDGGGIPISTTIGSYPGLAANETFTLGAAKPNIDDCFIVTPPASIPLDTRSSALTRLTTAYHPESKIHLEVYSTEPAFQFYTGKYIHVQAVGGAPARGSRAGFCVEPSRYVDAINRDEWKGQVVLKKGEVYGSRIVYKGWSDE